MDKTKRINWPDDTSAFYRYYIEKSDGWHIDQNKLNEDVYNVSLCDVQGLNIIPLLNRILFELFYKTPFVLLDDYDKYDALDFANEFLAFSLILKNGNGNKFNEMILKQQKRIESLSKKHKLTNSEFEVLVYDQTINSIRESVEAFKSSGTYDNVILSIKQVKVLKQPITDELAKKIIGSYESQNIPKVLEK